MIAAVGYLLRLMGMMPTQVLTPGLSDARLAGMLGNSMSVNVLERILSRALDAAGLKPWKSMTHSWESLARARARVRKLR